MYNCESFLEVKNTASPTRLSYPAKELTKSRVFSMFVPAHLVSNIQGEVALQSLVLSCVPTEQLFDEVEAELES